MRIVLVGVMAVATAAVSGCGTSPYGMGLCDPTVSQMGADTYYAGANCASPAYGMKAANLACGRVGRRALVTNVRSNSDIVFRCLNPNDPELSRPNYQRTPDVIIQDNRR